MTTFCVAAAQYDIGFFGQWDDYAQKIERWVRDAAESDAQLLVFPEYGSMELASLFGEAVYRDLERQIHAMQDVYRDVQDLHGRLAREHDVLILGASFPVRQPDGRFHNRATLFGPDGILGFQDKLIMTRFENEQWHISAGQGLGVIPTDLGTFGINICYDAEFPLIARQQVQAGADVILVPSCTDTQAGFYRVRVGCQARALENQCFVVQSSTVGEASWSEAVDVNTGRASVYTPIDYGFPDDGVLAQGEEGKAAWVYAEIDPAKAREIRSSGQVFNYRDWPKQNESGITLE